MRLTQFTDYACRVLIYLGIHPERAVTIREIAASYDISRNHLMKVVNHLVNDGFIVASRGPGGGLRLARPPAEINLGAVVRSTEADQRIVECFGPDNECCIAPVCRLKRVLAEALNGFLAVLDRYTLADLIERPKQLAALLPVVDTTPD